MFGYFFMATLQDVARRAGVSTATVSKVLSNTPYFTEQTRQKVMHAVEELNYRPNLAARALSTGKTRIIALVLPHIYDAIFKDPHVMAILEGVEAETTRADYSLLLSTPQLSQNGADENFKRLIRSGYIDGMIAIDNVPIASVAKEAREQAIPTVVIGYHESEYRVLSDDRQGGRMIVDHVLRLGHRRIGFISVEQNKNFAVNERVAGMGEALEQHGLDIDMLPCVESDFSTAGGARAVAELMHSHPDLTAIICLNDRMAMGAVQQLHHTGYRVPDDLTVTGYDNLAVTGIYTPPLTTVDQKATVLGQMAVNILMGVLADKVPAHIEQSPVVLSPELVVRASSAAPRK